MVVSCCAYGCTERAVKGGPVTFHCFPNDEERRKIWETKIRRENFKATKSSRLCSKHFTPDCFDREKFGGTWLKKTAVPTIFDFPKHLIQKKVTRKPLVKKTPEPVVEQAGVNGLKRRVLKKNAIPSRNLPISPECDDKTKDDVKLKKIKRSMSEDKILVCKRMPPAERKLVYMGETSSYESKDPRIGIQGYQEEVTNETSSSYLDEIPEKRTVTSPFITRLSVMTSNNSTVNAVTPEQNSENLEKCSQNFREPLLPVKYKENSELDCLEYNSSPDDSTVNANTSEQNSEDVEKCSQNFRQPLLPVKYKENSELDCSKYNSSPDDSKETLTQKLEAMISINAKLQKRIKFYQSRCQMYEKEVNIMKGVIDSLKQINSVTFDY